VGVTQIICKTLNPAMLRNIGDSPKHRRNPVSHPAFGGSKIATLDTVQGDTGSYAATQDTALLSCHLTHQLRETRAQAALH
jgi:hypothetical protein